MFRTAAVALLASAVVFLGGCEKKSEPEPTSGSVSLSPTSVAVELGGTAAFTATGSGAVTFRVDGAPAAGTIDATGQYTAPATMPASATVQVVAQLASDPAVTATASATLVPRFVLGLESISLSPSALQLAPGQTAQLTATGAYTSGSTRDLTSTVTWTSSDPAVVTVTDQGASQPGALTRVGSGSATITATFAGVSSSVEVQEPGAEFVGVSPAAATVEPGGTAQFTADASGAVSWWVRGAPEAGTIDASGLYTAPASAPGTSTVEVVATLASNGDVSAVGTVTLVPRFTLGLESVTVSPSSVDLAAGASAQLTATGHYAGGGTQDLTTLATWSSSSASAVTVTPAGAVQRVGAGEASITATFAGQSDSATIHEVGTPFVAVSPSTATVEVGGSADFSADASGAVSWSVTGGSSAGTVSTGGRYTAPSELPSNATVELVAALASDASVNDTATITLVPRFTVGLQSVSVAPSSVALAMGATAQLTATGSYQGGGTRDLTALATWTSSNPAAVTVSGTGEVRRAGAGTAVISASHGGKTGTAAINEAFVVVTPDAVTVELSGSTTFSASSSGPVTWSVTGGSANGSIDADGVYSAPAAMPASSTVQVAAVLVSDGTVGDVATVTLVPRDTLGLSAISVAPETLSLAAGRTATLTATGHYGDGSTRDLSARATWTSAAMGAVTVDGTGSVTRVGAGSAQISAAFGGFSDTAQVDEAFVRLSPSTATVELTGTTAFSSDASGAVTWSVTGGAANGSVSAAGVYTAPATMPSSGSVEVVAELTADASVRATASVTLVPRFTLGLVSIEVTPAALELAKGATAQLTATGHYTNGDTRNLTPVATWITGAPAAVTVSTSGVVSRIGDGVATITATFDGKTDTATIDAPAPVFVEVSPAVTTLELGTTQQFTASASGPVTWSVTGGAANGTVDPNGLYSAPASMPSSATVEVVAALASDATVTDVATVTLVPRDTIGLASLTVAPDTVALAAGRTAKLTATGHYSDGSTRDLSARATWTSDTSAAVTVDATGTVTRVGSGTARVTAAFAGFSDLTTVLDAFVQVSPATATVELTGTTTFTATASGPVTWSVTGGAANGSVNASGTYTAPGSMPSSSTVQVVAALTSDATVLSTATVTLVPRFTLGLASIQVTPASLELAKGATAQLTATGHYANGSTQNLTGVVAWSTSSEAAVTVNASGLISRVGDGVATITATFDGKSDSATIDAPAPGFVGVFPATATLELEGTQLFTATASGAVTWSVTGGSSNGSIDAFGLYTAPATMPGSSTVEVVATLDADTTISATATVTLVPRFTLGLASIEVSPDWMELAEGATAQLTATGHYLDGSTRDLTSVVTWTTNAASAVTVSASGLASRVGDGVAVITASFDGRSDSATIDAPAPGFVEVSPTTATVELGTTQQFSATASGSVTWSVVGGTANGSVDASGLYTAPVTLPASSTVEVVATLDSDPSVTGKATVTLVPPAVTLETLTVSPATVSIGVGATTQLIATGTYSDGTTADLTSTAVWTSDAESVATVGTSGSGTPGAVTTHAGGTARITASHEGVSGSADVTAVPVTLARIDVSPATATVPAGTSQAFVATAVYSDGTTVASPAGLTWSLRDVVPSGAVTVDGGGLVRAYVAGGTATVVATLSGVTGTADVTVGAATLSSIEVTPVSSQLPAGFDRQLTAVGLYSDGSRADLTAQATWAPTSGATASVSDAAGSRGLVTAHAASSTPVEITATFGSITGAASVTVTSPALLSIDVQPSTPSIAKGTVLAFTATGLFSDGSRVDVTAQVSWTSSSTACATIETSGLARGILSAGASCTTNIVAQHPSDASVTGSTVLTVTNAALVTLDVNPTTPRIATGSTLQFVAIGTFTDGSTQELTSDVVWSSSDATVATVSATGLATGVATVTATTTITATSALNIAISDATTLTVTASTLTSISVAPTSATLVPGQVVQLTATGHYSDGVTVDLTSVATWRSSEAEVATVSNATGSAGQVTGSASCGVADCGTTAVTATFSGITSAAAELALNGITLTTVTVSPTGVRLPVGYRRPFTAVGTYSDGSTRDLTLQVAWSSSNTAVATISNAAGTAGVATGVAAGTVTITATMASPTGPVSGTATLTVNTAKIQSIAVTPAVATISVGDMLQLTATATFNDAPATVLDVTTQVTWKYSPRKSAPATVSAAGRVTGLSAGTSTITAQKGGKSATASITVSP